MFERLTIQARSAIALSHEVARGVGHHECEPGDLLRGLLGTSGSLAADALTNLGITADALPPGQASRNGPTGTGHIPLSHDYKQVLERALGESIALGHSNVTTGHLLLGIIAVLGKLEIPVLSTLDVTEATIRDAVSQQHSHPSSDEVSLHPTAELAIVDSGWRPPRRSSVIGEILLSFLWYLATGLLLILVTWSHDNSDLVAPVLALFPLIMVLGVPSSVARARAIKRIRRNPVYPLALPEAIAYALTQRRVTALEIRVETGRVNNRCYRFGRRAWIVLAAVTVSQPRMLAFTLGHEVGHLLRNDSLRRGVARILHIGVLAAALTAFDSGAILIGVTSVLVHSVLMHWWSELSCDAIGANLAGRDALPAWVASRRALLARPVNRRLRQRLRRLAGLLTHPPLWLRLARHDRQPTTTRT